MVKLKTVEDGTERTVEHNRPLTYTLEGFCAYNRISRQAFYRTYGSSPEFDAAVEYIREECEVDARRKFETGQIPCRLAGLWMSRYGYCARPTVIASESDIPKFEDI